MKLIKKIISSVCAISMIASMAAMVTASANDYTSPTLEAVLSRYDEETGEGLITVSVKGTSAISEVPQLTTLTHDIYFDGSFDYSYYTYNILPTAPVKQNIKGVGQDLTLYNVNNLQTANWIRVGFGPNTGSTWIGDTDVYTVAFKVTDTSQENTISFKNCSYIFNAYDSTMTNMEQKNYAQVGTPGAWTGELAYTGDLGMGGSGGGEIEITIPANGESSASTEGGSLVSIAPADLGLEGDVWTTDDPEFAGDNAVAALGNFEPLAEGAATQVEWTVSYTPVDGEASTVPMTFDLELGGIEANTTLGLIVGYNTADYSDVSIVSGTLK